MLQNLRKSTFFLGISQQIKKPPGCKNCRRVVHLGCQVPEDVLVIGLPSVETSRFQVPGDSNWSNLIPLFGGHVCNQLKGHLYHHPQKGHVFAELSGWWSLITWSQLIIDPRLWIGMLCHTRQLTTVILLCVTLAFHHVSPSHAALAWDTTFDTGESSETAWKTTNKKQPKIGKKKLQKKVA